MRRVERGLPLSAPRRRADLFWRRDMGSRAMRREELRQAMEHLCPDLPDEDRIDLDDLNDPEYRAAMDEIIAEEKKAEVWEARRRREREKGQ